MALYLLGKTSLDGLNEPMMNGKFVREYYSVIKQILSKSCPILQLTEPVITSGGKESFVSWYADTDNEPINIPEDKQEYVQNTLKQSVQKLQQHYSTDSFEGQLLNLALSLTNEQDILLADDMIILKQWGISKDIGNSYSLLNKYSSVKSIHTLEENSVDNQQQSPQEAIQPKTISSVPAPKTMMPVSGSIWSKGFPFLLSRLLAAIIFFIIGWIVGNRILYAERPIRLAGQSIMDAQSLVQKKPEMEKQNKLLEDENKKLEEQLKNPPCDLQKNRADPSLNQSVPTPFTPMKANGKEFQGSLPQLLEKSSVFILVLGQDENGKKALASGTGFFVTPDTIVTNRHVIEDSTNNIVLVTNKSLGQLKPARIVSASAKSQAGGFDLAVLQLQNAPPQQPLVFSLEAQPLQDVVAAGYPGMILRQDNALKRLIKGDIHAIPGVILTKGQINGIQENSAGEKVMPHSADVSPGNSGGPLVDLCGRVVGVNTFVTVDQDTSSHGNYAQKSDSIVRALQQANIPIQVQSGVCKPQDTTKDQQKSAEDQPNQQNNQKEPADHRGSDATKPSTNHGDKP